MNYKKLEKEVKENSKLLEKELPNMLKSHKDKYVVFNQGATAFTDSFQAAVEKGVKAFGENVGFVVRKVSKNTPVFSALVKL